MEIISYVVEGALEHKDSMGTGSIISPGEIQKMSAGTGVSHSEFNHSKNALVHFLQIWILPFKNNIVPSYEQKVISKSKNNQLLLLGSPEGGKEVIHIHQNVYLYTGYLQANNSIKHDFKNSKGWLQVVKGNLMVNNNALAPGDGAGIRDVSHIEMKGISDAEFLLFDLA
jgi:redox-sensitive bicupin YhaK (pirin superfamily)